MSDSDAGDGRAGDRPPARITWLFNLGLFALLVVTLGFDEMLLEPEDTRRVPLDDLFDAAPIRTIAGVAGLGVVLLAASIVFLRAFWRRFMTDVFKVRPITAAEAVAIVLILTLFVGP